MPKDLGERQVGIWTRVAASPSPFKVGPAQEEIGRADAAARGWVVEDVYRLEGVSAGAVRAHPETARMLADARSGRISALICSDLTRLGRSTEDVRLLIEELERYEVHLVSVEEKIDTTSGDGRFVLNLISTMAAYENRFGEPDSDLPPEYEPRTA